MGSFANNLGVLAVLICVFTLVYTGGMKYIDVTGDVVVVIRTDRRWVVPCGNLNDVPENQTFEWTSTSHSEGVFRGRVVLNDNGRKVALVEDAYTQPRDCSKKYVCSLQKDFNVTELHCLYPFSKSYDFSFSVFRLTGRNVSFWITRNHTNDAGFVCTNLETQKVFGFNHYRYQRDLLETDIEQMDDVVEGRIDRISFGVYRVSPSHETHVCKLVQYDHLHKKIQHLPWTNITRYMENLYQVFEYDKYKQRLIAYEQERKQFYLFCTRFYVSLNIVVCAVAVVFYIRRFIFCYPPYDYARLA